MNRVLSISFCIAAYAGFAAAVGYLSQAPAYQYASADRAFVKVSLSHATQRAVACVELTPEQIAELAPNMRRELECERARLPLHLELAVDGEPTFRIEALPSGLWNDGPVSIYERFELEPGTHLVSVKLRDSDRREGWDYVREEEVSLHAGRYFTITFRPEKGGFEFR